VSEPKTVAEQLDAAQDGQEFGQIIQNMFRSLESAKDAIDRATAALREVEADMGGDDE
jgi:hypothetical protein